MTGDNRDPDFDPLTWFADESDTSTLEKDARDRREANADPMSWFADESVPLRAANDADAAIALASPVDGLSSRAEVRADSPRAVTSPLALPAARGSSLLSSLSQWSGVRLLTFSGLAFVVGFTMSLWMLRTPNRVPEPAAPSTQSSHVTTATPPAGGSGVGAEPNRPQASTSSKPPALPAPATMRPEPPDSARRARLAESDRKERVTEKTGSPMLKDPLMDRPTTRAAPRAAPVEAARRGASAPVPAAVPEPAGGNLTPVPSVPVPEVVPTPVVEARSPAALEEVAVRQTLDEYVDAYEGLDVDATAHVWPSVDRQALARAFATLKSQGVAFAACNLDVAEATAVARCHGTVEFVRRVGNPTPRVEQQQWLFRMRKLGTGWKIEDVTAGRAASSSQAVRGSMPPEPRRH